ncbi:type I secretion target repeat-containing protein, partial [Rhodobacteraceae bacterium CCMM004]
GDDEFRGLGGWDWIVGSEGRDRYDGGSGQDMVAYTQATGSVTASLLLGRGTAGAASGDYYTSIESLSGGNFDDDLTGDHGRNKLRGMYGEDTLRGNGGNDTLEGGGSDDLIFGGAGWDRALYAHNRADYEIVTNGNMTTVRYLPGRGEGTDTLYDVEALFFADETVYL